MKNYLHTSNFLLIALSVILLSNCTPNNKPTPPPPQSIKKTYISKGDPLELIKGAQTEPLLKIKPSEIDSYGKFIINSSISFQEKDPELKVDEDMDDMKEEQAPAEEGYNLTLLFLNQFTFSFSQVDEAHLSFKGTLDLDSVNLDGLDDSIKEFIASSKTRITTSELLFKKVDDGYEFLKSETREDGVITNQRDNATDKFIHISISKDKSALSFLFTSHKKRTGSSLDMISFTKLSANTPKIGNKSYNYIYGPGVKVRWNTKEDKEISICGEQSQFLKYPIETALKKWQNNLKVPLNFQVKYQSEYRPFSDLNQNCVFYVKNYRTKSSLKAFSPGFNLAVRDYSEGRVLSSNIIFLEEEYLLDVKVSLSSFPSYYENFNTVSKLGFEKTFKKHRDEKTKEEIFNSSIYKSYFLDSPLHEMGHFLGLDHIFDGTPSIMSYEYSDGTLTEYDKLAIQELYKD